MQIVALLAVVAGAAAQTTNLCSSPSCYAGAQFSSGNKLSAAEAIGNLQAPCYQSTPNGVACFAYTTAGSCPNFAGMSDCGGGSVVTKTPLTTTLMPTTSVVTTTPLTTSAPVAPSSRHPATPGGASTTSPGATPATPRSTTGPDGSSSGTSSPNSANNNANMSDSSSSGPGVWPYLVGGGAALLLIGVIVILLVRKSRDGDDDDEVENHIYQSQHRSGKHSIQSVSGTHLSPYDMKHTHAYDVETGYQPTIGYHDPRPAAAYQPSYAPQSPYRAKPAPVAVQANQFQAPPAQHQGAPSTRDMHLLNAHPSPDIDRQSVTF
ncbi:hypothetical protein ACHHYP_12270 [Achlya hypogyna]|uniref:Secreted protein n=1 Tax=Achlya hypogyna TaxID=1202772 RepID=A0A1V9YHC7_ACHHY|nr:hypothetical protein ACHHYP_12270 [Achlya hypogyna]